MLFQNPKEYYLSHGTQPGAPDARTAEPEQLTYVSFLLVNDQNTGDDQALKIAISIKFKNHIGKF
jgi:hypothetical protein